MEKGIAKVDGTLACQNYANIDNGKYLKWRIRKRKRMKIVNGQDDKWKTCSANDGNGREIVQKMRIEKRHPMKQERKRNKKWS